MSEVETKWRNSDIFEMDAKLDINLKSLRNVCKQTFRKLDGYIIREFLGLRMRNFQGIIFM